MSCAPGCQYMLRDGPRQAYSNHRPFAHCRWTPSRSSKGTLSNCMMHSRGDSSRCLGPTSCLIGKSGVACKTRDLKNEVVGYGRGRRSTCRCPQDERSLYTGLDAAQINVGDTKKQEEITTREARRMLLVNMHKGRNQRRAESISRKHCSEEFHNQGRHIRLGSSQQATNGVVWRSLVADLHLKVGIQMSLFDPYHLAALQGRPLVSASHGGQEPPTVSALPEW